MKARQHSTFGGVILLIALAMVRHATSKCSGGFDVYFLLDKSSSVAILDFQVSSYGYCVIQIRLVPRSQNYQRPAPPLISDIFVAKIGKNNKE